MTDLVPNEILVRYDENGKFQGAHVAYLKLIRDASGVVVHRELQNLIPVSSPTDPAFMDVLSKVLTDALTENNELKAQIATHETEESQPMTPAITSPAKQSYWPWIFGGLIGFIAALILATTVAHATPPIPTVLVGVRANQDGTADSAGSAHNEALFLAVQTQSGLFAIDSEYKHNSDFSSTLPLDQAQWDVANGYVPMVTWFWNDPGACRKLADIAAGLYDTDYAGKAVALAAVGGNILLRADPAMDTQARQCMYDYNVLTDPQDAGPQFVAAWQHVYSVIHPLAPNVRWNWSPGDAAFSSNNNIDTRWQYFWPGPSYVDWVGVEDYNSDAFTDVSIQADPGTLNWYSQASLLGKPMIFSETGAGGPDPQMDANGYGCTYSTGLTTSAQQRWLYSMSTNLKTTFPLVHAIVWFDTKGQGGPNGCLNYVIRGDGMTAFSNLLSKVYFQANTLP